MGNVNMRDLPDGAWKDLLPHALSIIEEIKSHGTSDPFWTLGGGTVRRLISLWHTQSSRTNLKPT